jgi:transposase
VYIRKSIRSHKGKQYTNHLLVESVHTEKGPRQRVICSLGSLAPGPREEWLALAHKLQASLAGQLWLQAPEPALQALIEKAGKGRKRAGKPERSGAADSIVAVDTDRVEVEEAVEAGPVHVGHEMWRALGLDEILRRAGLSDRACRYSEAMTLNRLVFPSSEHAMPDWIRRTAVPELVGGDFSKLQEDALYRNLDRLHPNRERIERELAAAEKTLFNLDDTLYLYDLTSTYFEGQVRTNRQARRGYSRDHRPDCKQVVVGLVLDGDGFAKAHEVFDGNRRDASTVEAMLQVLEKRTGKRAGSTVIVDRGMAYEENLRQIRAKGLHYIVAGRQPERNQWLAEIEEEEGWEEVLRTPSPRNAGQKKTRVEVKRRQQGEEIHLLCRSEGRQEKDRAIRQSSEERLKKDLERLKRRIAKGHLKHIEKVHEAIGRLQERYPRVARYYRIQYSAAAEGLGWEEDEQKKKVAEKLDGSYVLKTDRQDLTPEEIWRTYMLLTRVEAAFRAMKSPLMERPIFHHLEHRTQTHIFLCVLAYHLLVAIEKRFLDQGLHTSWWTLRQQLSTHQVVTVVLPTSDGSVLKIRKGTTPSPAQREIYQTLKVPSEIIKPIKSWHQAS